MPTLPNIRREAYAQALAKGTKQINAYRAAGYTGDTAASSKLASNPEVVTRVREIVEQKQRIAAKGEQKAILKVALTEEWILERLMYLAERCLRGQPELDKNGVQTGRFIGRPDSSGANKALELLGKHKAMFIDRHEFGQPGAFASLSDDELTAKIADMGSQLGIPPKALQAMVGGQTKH